MKDKDAVSSNISIHVPPAESLLDKTRQIVNQQQPKEPSLK